MQLEVWLERKGVVRDLPAAFAKVEDSVYGGNLAYSLSIVDAIAETLGRRSLAEFIVDLDALADEVEFDLGEDADEDEIDGEVAARASYFATADALATLDEIIAEFERSPTEHSPRFVDAYGLDGTLWDLRVVREILLEADRAGDSFFFWIG